MKISYNWLHEFLPETIALEKLCKILTATGLEVEGTEIVESVKGSLKGIVIGKVVTCDKHPNADKLKLTTVNVGEGENLQIVCGAANVAVGQTVVVATVGSTIYPLEKDPLQIKKANIRSVESFGMICAEDEIGLSNNHDGIIVIDTDIAPGTLASTYFNIETDHLIEIGLTANRSDANSHLGVAREVMAWLAHNEKSSSKLKLQATEDNFSDKPDCSVAIEITDKEGAPRYAGLVIENITVQPSPTWLQNRLKTIGVRSINNIVDVTNYILHETGQPLHAFDLNTIDDNKIIVQKAGAGEKFTTLDEVDRTLLGNEIMISDASKHLCIAGIFGGLTSGVTDKTNAIFLESAFFTPERIRVSSMAHGLRTDAATHFEKTTDISALTQVLKRALYLIQQVSPGAAFSKIVDYYPTPAQKKEISLKYQYLKKLSGKHYHPETVKNIFEQLGFELVKEGLDELHYAVPYYKTDISIPADLVEEIVRIDGLDNIEIPKRISLTPATNKNNSDKLKQKISQTLVGMGAYEVLTNSIVNSKYYTQEELGNAVKMLNNLSTELDVLRLRSAESLLLSISQNVNRQQYNIFFFEFAKVYSQTDVINTKEENKLCLALSGNKQNTWWQQKAEAWDVYAAKGIVTSILQTAGLNVTFTIDNNTIGILLNKKSIGTIELVNTKTLKQFDIKQPVIIIDLNWDFIKTEADKQKLLYQEISKFPAVERDLSLLVDKAISYQQLSTAINATQLKSLSKHELFDLFESEKIGTDKKSLAVRFTFTPSEATFTDEAIDKMMQKIETALSKQGAEVRRS
jgi:phenylalanyl-tRNA synthetase beta chain